MTKEYKKEQCFDLMTRAVQECFMPTREKKQYEARRGFAKSKILSVWCDCTDNFEYRKTRALILSKLENEKATSQKKYWW